MGEPPQNLTAIENPIKTANLRRKNQPRSLTHSMNSGSSITIVDPNKLLDDSS